MLPDMHQIAIKILRMEEGPDHTQAVILHRYLFGDNILSGSSLHAMKMGCYGRSLAEMITDQPDGFATEDEA